jgi:hypothetical protein
MELKTLQYIETHFKSKEFLASFCLKIVLSILVLI